MVEVLFAIEFLEAIGFHNQIFLRKLEQANHILDRVHRLDNSQF
ncbi:MAG: hypothetical protein WCD53_16470 [Microcoleus sp.]